MTSLIHVTLLVAASLLAIAVSGTVGWSGDDRVLLKDISVLTLYHGRMTNARRSSAIPQMKCLGGTAGCTSFSPQVVQCYNRGSDGYDIQWECKTDMDNAYRFGRVEVSCEGYEYPDDPYVLKGSCGLEYTLDLTKEGMAQQNQGHSYYGDSNHGSSYTKSKSQGKSSGLSDLITLAIMAVVIYALYKTCLSSAGQDGARTDDRRDNQRRPNPSAPPPPGFRDEYMPGGGCSSNSDYDSYTRTTPPHGSTAPQGSTGGGFWSGAATGGILGYLFGSRTNTGYQQPYGGAGYGGGWGSRTGWGSGWGSGLGSGRSYGGGSSTWGSGGGSSFRAASTGTRTASGFGGTKRR